MTTPPRTRGEWIDELLRSAILNGDIPPGERIKVASLAEKWDVSPTPLREALPRLAAEGLVDLIPQRGARVAGVSIAELLEIYEIRLALEPLAIARSVEQATAADIEGCKKAFTDLEAAYTEPIDRLVTEPAHRDFHIALIDACGSSWLRRMCGLMLDHSSRYRIVASSQRGGASKIIDEHSTLLNAYVDRDPERASRALRAHLELTVRAAMEAMSTDRDDVTTSTEHQTQE